MAISPTSPVRPTGKPPAQTAEDGYLLLAVLFLLVVLLLTLGIAAPKIAVDLQRDREIEAIHRGHEYARAIGVFYRKFGRYPASIDQLMSTNNQRFLRKRYLDPLTGKDDWRLIHYGEAQAGAGALGQNSIPGASAPGSPIGATDSSSPNPGVTSPSPGSSGSGGSLLGGNSGGSSSPFGGGSGSTSIFGNSGGSSSPFSGSQSGPGSSGSPFGGPSGTGTGSSPFGTPGASSGGAPIVGVGLPSKKESIKTLKKQTHYNKWEFVYDPAAEQNAALNFGNNQNGNGINGTGTNGLGGNGLGTNGLGGGNSGFGGSPPSPTSPASPSGGPGSSSPFSNTQ